MNGLVAYLRAEKIGAVVDATHPFAAQMSRNAIEACRLAGVPLLGLQRAAWVAAKGRPLAHVDSIEAAVDALPVRGTGVFGDWQAEPCGLSPPSRTTICCDWSMRPMCRRCLIARWFWRAARLRQRAIWR